MPYETENLQGRTFDINQPSGTPTKAVIFCHGYSGNSTAVALQLGNPDPDNYYMVFPNGTMINTDPTKRLWNASGGLLALIEAGFIANIIQHLESLNVTEVYIGGHSNGAILSAYLIAKYPELFNGALLVSGYLHNNVIEVKPHDIPIKHIHGVNDDIVPLIGAEYNIKDHLNKFINAGNFVNAELLPADHSLANLNVNNKIIEEIEKLLGV